MDKKILYLIDNVKQQARDYSIVWKKEPDAIKLRVDDTVLLENTEGAMDLFKSELGKLNITIKNITSNNTIVYKEQQTHEATVIRRIVDKVCNVSVKDDSVILEKHFKEINRELKRRLGIDVKISEIINKKECTFDELRLLIKNANSKLELTESPLTRLCVNMTKAIDSMQDTIKETKDILKNLNKQKED